MRAALALVVVVTSACRIEDGLVACGDLACPVGLVCTAGGCTTRASADACIGLDDGDSCSSAGVPDGTCTGGGCFPVGCGNGVVDHDEACDDGNNLYKDGCSADCRSDETCGNGITDFYTDEQCDSGVVGLSSTGCTSRCTIEIEIWRERTPMAITARSGSVVAFDADRGRLLLFGGYTGGWENDTWEWTGTAWRKLRPPASPQGRSGHSMAYDPHTKRMVLFGGSTLFGIRFGDTWEWDGVTWTERTPVSPALSPSARSGAAMAYNPTRQVIQLFGGQAADGTLFDDLWEWDGIQWTKVTVSNPPEKRTAATLAADPATGNMLLYGGVGATSVLGDTWLWTGTGWQQHGGAGPLPPRLGAMMTADATGIVLVGGRNLTPGSDRKDTWAWNGGWTQLVGDDAPAVRSQAAFGYDASRDELVVFGGANDATLESTTWRLDMNWSNLSASAWTVLAPVVIPSARGEHALAYDARRGRTVLFGGQNGGVRYGDTWEWDGLNWMQVATTGPAARSGSVMAYDSERGRVVAFGGLAGAARNDLWTWDGVAWTQVTIDSTDIPEPRFLAGMAYDRARDQFVVFGGGNLAMAFGDTWVFEPATNRWTRVMAPGPAPRTGATLTYDPVRDRVVLLGGNVGGNFVGEVWEWNGATLEWTQRLDTLPGMLLPRAHVGMTYDPSRDTILSFGGVTVLFGQLQDMLEWDGETLVSRTLPLMPPRRSSSPIVFDTVAHAAVVVGGSGTQTALADTWVRVFESYDVPPERCVDAMEDSDGDGFFGCADPDCAGRCTPECLPGRPCSTGPRCGNGTCDPLEDYLICGDCTRRGP